MKSSRQKPFIPQPEHNTLIQLLKKSDRLLENEMKDLLHEEKAAYNREIRSRGGTRSASTKAAPSKPIKPQEMTFFADNLPPVQISNAGESGMNTSYSPNDMSHMAAFTPRLIPRPKSASRNNVLGKSGVNYNANAYSSYQRMSNQYTTRRVCQSPSSNKDQEQDFFNLPNSRPSTARSQRNLLKISTQISAENIRVMPSSSVQTLLDRVGTLSLEPIIPPSPAISSPATAVIALPQQLLAVSPPASEIKSAIKKSKSARKTSLHLPIQKIDIQIHGVSATERPHSQQRPLSARVIEDKAYDERAALDVLASTEVGQGLNSPKFVVLNSPTEKQRPNSQRPVQDSPITPLSARPISSKAILRRYHNLNVPLDDDVADDTPSFNNSAEYSLI